MAKMTVTVDGAGVFVRGLTPIEVDKIRAEGRCAEVLRAIVHDARQLCYKADMQEGRTSWECRDCRIPQNISLYGISCLACGGPCVPVHNAQADR